MKDLKFGLAKVSVRLPRLIQRGLLSCGECEPVVTYVSHTVSRHRPPGIALRQRAAEGSVEWHKRTGEILACGKLTTLFDRLQKFIRRTR